MANEKRLIDANALFPNGVFYVNGDNPMTSLDELLNRIATAPSVDAVEVVHARWLRYEHGSGIYCSHCRHKRRYKDANDNYCPNCGAKMDGGNEDV
jgi:hypothetical protein